VCCLMEVALACLLCLILGGCFFFVFFFFHIQTQDEDGGPSFSLALALARGRGGISRISHGPWFFNLPFCCFCFACSWGQGQIGFHAGGD
jgi:hypothetical protein